MARVALWRAACHPVPDGGQFEPWAATWIKQALLNYFRSHRLLLPLVDKEGNAIDVEAPEPVEPHELVNRDELKTLLRVLNRADRELILLRFGLGQRRPWKTGRLAQWYGISPREVNRRLRRALDTMRLAAASSDESMKNPAAPPHESVTGG